MSLKLKTTVDTPLVSIIIPCYNADHYVAEAIQSALDQTYGNCEIIVIDDGSTDSSLEIIKGFGNRIRWETGPKRGGCAARSRGLALASGDWIQFLDADDKLSECKIESQLDQVGPSTATRTVLVCPWCHFTGNKEEQLFDLKPYMSSVTGADVLVKMWSRGDMFAPHSWLTSRSIVGLIGPWDETLVADQDGEYFGRVLCAAKNVICVQGVKALYRKPGPENVSSSVSKKSMLSRFKAWQSVKQKLLEQRNDRRAKRAVLGRLRSVAYRCRRFPDIIEQAHHEEKKVGFQGAHLGGHTVYSLLSSFIGLKATLRVRSLIKVCQKHTECAGVDLKGKNDQDHNDIYMAGMCDSSCPLVSIIIPCYNCEEYVREAIESALLQTYENCEVIVIDDGSTDNSLGIIRSFGDRIQWKSVDNSGGCAARNYGIQLSRGQWIQFLDGDDKISLGKIEKQMKLLLSIQSLNAIAGCPWRHFEGNEYDPLNNVGSYIHSKDGASVLSDMWLKGEMFPLHSWLTSRQLVEMVGSWDESLVSDQDGDYFGRILCAADHVVFIEEEEALYRRPGPGNVSSLASEQSMWSRYRVWESVKGHLLKRSDSRHARKAIVVRLRVTAYRCRNYPEIIDLARSAEKEFGVRCYLDGLRSRYMLLCSLVGIKAALRVRSVFKD